MPREVDRRDVRTDRSTDERADELSERAAGLVGAAGLLGISLPAATVARLDPVTGNAALLTFDRPRPQPRRPEEPGGPTAGLGGAVGPSAAALVQRALEAVQLLSPALGLEPGQPAEFTPDPNVQRISSGASSVHLGQRYKSLPVFQAATAVRFDVEGQLAALAGRTVSVTQDRDPAPALSAEEALQRAAAHLADDPGDPVTDEFGQQFPPPRLDLTGFTPTVLARFPNDPEQITVFEAGPFEEPVRIGLTWFPLSADQLRLTWEVVATMPGRSAQYRVLVDAVDGDVLYSHDLVRAVHGRADVFPVDGQGPRISSPLPLPPDQYGLPLPADLPAAFPLDWIDADTTAGACAHAHAGDSPAAPRGTRQPDGTVVFGPNAQSADQAILNAFFFASLLHDFFYLLGFREPGGAFQQVPHPGVEGGASSDRVDVRVYPHAVPLTASMFTPIDGVSPVMKLGTVDGTGRHTAMDFTVVAHEYTHGVTNRLVGGALDTRALEAPQCRGMGEGWGDYVACSVTGRTTVASWVVGKPAGIRQFAYDDRFPADRENFGMIGRGRYIAEHAIGELWCAALMDLNREIGDTLALQLVVDGLKLSPANPSFLDMRDAILSALDFAEEGGQVATPDAADARAGAWRVFARHGMGPAAASNGPFLTGVVPDFSEPDLSGRPAIPAATTQQDVVAQVTTPVPVPDSPAPGIVSSLQVDAPGTVGSLELELDISHPVPADLVVRLIAPSGRAVVVHDRRDTGRPGIVSTWHDMSAPQLAGLRGEQIAGTWRLEVTDVERKDVGVVNRWTLRIRPATGPSGSGLAQEGPVVDVTAQDREVSLRVVLPDAAEAEDFVVVFRGWLNDYLQQVQLRSLLARSHDQAQQFLGAPAGATTWEGTPYYLNFVADW